MHTKHKDSYIKLSSNQPTLNYSISLNNISKDNEFKLTVELVN